MDTEKFRTLLCAIDTGSLTAAAEKLGYTPSGISRSVLAVEEEFGFPLLVRAKSGVTPTADCEKLLPIIRNLLRIEEQLQQTADRVCSLETGSVTVGTAYPVYDRILSKEIVAFRKLHPHISIRLIEGDAAEILPGLEGPFDFIFMDAAKGQYIRFLPEVIRLLRPGGVLLSDNVLKEGEILESKFVLTRRNRTIHKRMREYLTVISSDERLRTVLLETGDGAALSVRRRNI